MAGNAISTRGNGVINCGLGVILPNGIGDSDNPDDYFDPSTHIATEENFIAFLEAGGKYDDKSLVGYKVQLSNSVDYNNRLWVIADVGHHVDQPNTYDLISEKCFNYMRFSGNTQYWRDSDARSWLNNTFYNGFSENFKSHMNNIIYDSNGGTYNDDKIILPSLTEVNGTDYYFVVEGTAYPIFTDNNSRIKYLTTFSNYGSWWTRSRDTAIASRVFYIDRDGSVSKAFEFSNNNTLSPVLRVS